MPLGEIREVHEGEESWFLYSCSECGNEHDYEEDAVNCCQYECQGCGEIYDTDYQADECCAYSCDWCGASYDDPDTADDCCAEQRYEHEEERQRLRGDYPDAIRDIDPEHIVYLPAMEGRPVRICSIEQELSSGGAAVARMLHDLGISEYNTILNYSHEGPAGSAIVKHDGSLAAGGGEVVYSRFNLSDRTGVDRLSKALACIQALEREGIVAAGSDAGTHVHISAIDQERTPIGPAQMAGIYEIFSFGEDVIFRLGASGSTHHRGTSYTQMLPKFNQDERDGITASKIAKGSMRQRYFSLNFQRLLNAVHACRCGACVVGDWDDCECDVLRTGTVEWRVFNSTTDPETLHAWLLLAHGITAASFTHQLHTLPPHEYGQTDPELHPWIFGWLLWNCPYEDAERQILFNAARNSPDLNLPWDNIDLFHEGWGQLEIPEALMPEANPYEPEADGSFAGCECAACDAARREAALASFTVPGFMTTTGTGAINFNLDNVTISPWTEFVDDSNEYEEA